MGYTLLGGISDATKVDKFVTQAKTSNFTAAPGFIYLIDTTSGAVTATLPAANSAGQQVVVKWVAGSNAATVQRAGSDTIGAASTSASIDLLNEAWELTSSGSGQWNLTSGNKTLSSLDTRYASSLLTTGEETFSRETAASGTLTLATQSMRLTFFTARKTETTTQVRVITGGTAAAATPTLCRVGLYTIAGNGDGTLVASIANDTALFAATNTAYTRSWSSSYAKVAGVRYALGILVVTGAATPTFVGQVIGNAAEAAMAPALSAALTGQSDLPSSFTAGSLTATGNRNYGVVLP